MQSAIYEGKVRHRRFLPVQNCFEYRLFMMYLDLSELNKVFENRWLWSVNHWNLACFLRRDHFGDSNTPIEDAVRNLVSQHTGRSPEGPIRMLAHLRYFGHCFNPVTFFYCFDSTAAHVETIVAEVNNTPWHERHCYVLVEEQNDADDPWKHYQFTKAFHVSPFMDMCQNYDWRFLQPGDNIQVHMQNFQEDNKMFDATLSLKKIPLSKRSLARVLVQYPAMTLQIVMKIYWQALKLHFKGADFYPHPSKRNKINGKEA